MSTIRKKVLMTGFAPYGHHKTNPSWEGVKIMDKKKLGNKYNIKLIQREIAVRYDDVDMVVKLLWSNYKPDLTIHVGLSGSASCFVLETQANKKEYKQKDIVERCPEDNQHVCHGPDTLLTELDVAAICRKFNSNPEDELYAKISSNPGRFLCEYIYYTSLCRGRSPTLFVHVPVKKYTPEQLARGLERILELCLQQLPCKGTEGSETKRKRVLVTGFFPFSDLETNPSSEGMIFMDRTELEKKYDIILSRQEIPVRYAEVDRIVPLLWDSCRPHLTIHFGVSEAVSHFVLETRANKSGYEYPDIDEQYPASCQNVCDGPDSIDTDLDVEAICREFNRVSCVPGGDLRAEISNDAGRHLCEYIYYTSLCRSRSSALFVNVPLLTYTSAQLAQGLERILELCLKHLPKDDYYCHNIV